jgi:hypothetical protein
MDKFSSSLSLYGHPELLDALEKDEAQMFHLIRHVLNSDTSEQIVLDLREEKAMVFLNLLCTAVSLFHFFEASHDVFNCHAMQDEKQIVQRRSKHAPQSSKTST